MKRSPNWSGDPVQSPGTRKPRTQWLAKLLLFSLICLTIVSILSLINLYWLRQTAWWTTHTRTVIEMCDAAELSFSKAEVWYQSYQLLGNEGGVWRSGKDVEKGKAQLADLLQLTADNPVQQERLKRTISITDSWIAQRNDKPSPTRPFPKILPELREARTHEAQLLSTRRRRADAVRRTTFFANCGLVVFSLVSIGFLWRKWNQENIWTVEILGRLSAAEARFESFMDHSPLMAFIRTRNSETLYCNEPWRRFTGSKFDPATRRCEDRDSSGEFRQFDQSVLENNRPHEFVEEMTAQDGSVHQFLAVTFPFSPGDGTTLVGGVALDVTDARQTQKALEESEQRLRLALQAGSMEVWEIDLEKNEVFAKSANFRATGRGDDYTHLPFDATVEFIVPEHRAEIRDKIQTAVRDRTPYHATYRTVFGRWIASSGVVQADGTGKAIRMIGFMQDETDKIDAENKLAELRKLHDSILRCAHVALISIGKDRVVTSWNPAAERLIGYSAEEVVGLATPDLWESRTEAETRAKQSGAGNHLHSDPFLAQALLRGEDTRDWFFTRKDGSRVPVRLTVTPIFGDGGLLGFLKHVTDISELRRANHQVEELNQALQDTLSGWAKLDIDGHYVGVNRAYAQIAGYAVDELIGIPWKSTIHPDDAQLATDSYHRMITQGKTEMRAKGIRKDGSTFNEEVFLVQARDYVGMLVGSYCFMRDITARVESEQKLANSERRYRALFELNPMPCWIYNPQTLGFLNVNEAAVQHYGYSEEEFLSMTLNTIRVPEEAVLIERELETFTKLSGWTSGPWHHRLRDGQIIDVELAARRLSDTARLVVIRDITEQKQTELLRRSEAKLQEAQRIARLGSWELDTKSGVVTWSTETFRIFGLTDFKGKLLMDEFLGMVHPDDRNQVASTVAHSVEKADICDLQFRILRQNGELRHIHGRGEYSNGSRQRFAGTMLDITEEKRAHEALQQSLEEKEVLIKEIHHRVKNNLQVISCLLNMQAGVVKEPTAVAALQESERRVMAMAGIHERLYGHKRLDRINFRDYAETLVHDLVSAYAAENSQIEGHLNVASIDLHIEQALPCGLILNELVTNALKYAYPQGGAGEIFVSLEQSGQKLRLAVKDRGKGLPENFDWRKSKSLGVSIVNLLTRQLGGTMQIKSSPSGTTFSVEFEKMT